MRLTRLLAFFPLLLTALALPTLSHPPQETDTASEAQKGTVPRSSAERYKTHAIHGQVSVGAELLTRKQVSKAFAADVNSCCLVVQVAVYPNEREPLKLSRDDFMLAIEGTDGAARPQSAIVLSAKLTKDPNGGVTTAASVGVGVEFGTYTDPSTGRPVHVRGVTTSASIGVGVGSSVPGRVTERQREVIERELSENSLPEARISVPVSGYLYFLLPKHKKPAKYRLEYSLKDETLILPLP